MARPGGARLGIERGTRGIESHGIHAGASPDRKRWPDHLLGPDQGGGQQP